MKKSERFEMNGIQNQGGFNSEMEEAMWKYLKVAGKS